MTVRAVMRRICAFVFVLLPLASQAVAQSGERQPPRSGPGTGNPDEHRVPWRFLASDAPAEERPVTLYWLPVSTEQAERSRLMTSSVLIVAATRCVNLEIVLPERTKMVQTLGATGRMPAAVIVDRHGTVVRRVENVRGVLAAEAVERMVSDELAARDEAMYKEMSDAGREARSGNNPAAIDLYQKIWQDRCLFPLAGHEAQRALKDLGVIVKEPPSTIAADPNLQPPVKTETGH